MLVSVTRVRPFALSRLGLLLAVSTGVHSSIRVWASERADKVASVAFPKSSKPEEPMPS